MSQQLMQSLKEPVVWLQTNFGSFDHGTSQLYHMYSYYIIIINTLTQLRLVFVNNYDIILVL